MYTAVLTASPQKRDGTFMLFRRHHTISTMVSLRLSMMPFCCGEYGVVV
jgi:hypothetical protein